MRMSNALIRTVAACTCVAGAVAAQAAPLGAGSADWGRWFGASLGNSDYGTAARLTLGTQLGRNWAIEGQALTYGSETYTEFGNSYKRSAYALGVSGLGLLPLTPSIAAFGKVGLHWLHSEATGPGLDESRNGAKLGLGGGVGWQMTPTLGLRAEYESIGGGDGNLLSLGLQFKF